MRALRPVLSAALTLVMVTAWARSAWAHTIAVVRPAPSDEVLTESFSRLCGELRMYGLEVTLLDPQPTADSDEPPAALGGGEEFVGAVSLVRAAGQASAKIWIAEKASSNVRITVSIDDVDAPSLLAIRAADLLRASLRDFAGTEAVHAEPPRAAETAVAGSANERSCSGFDRWSLQAGASLLWETGKLGTGFAPSVRLGRRLTTRIALALSIEAPSMGQSYAVNGATARLRQELGVLAIAWRALGRQRLAVDLFQGLGVMRLSARGEAPSPWIGQSTSGWAGASATGGTFVLHLSARAGLTVALAAVFLLPRPVLEVADASYVAHQPLLLTSVGLQYGF